MVALARVDITLDPDLRTFKTQTERGIAAARLDRAGAKAGTQFGQGFGKSARDSLTKDAGVAFSNIAGSAKDLNKQMDDLNSRVVRTRVRLDGDSETQFALDQIKLKMAKLSQQIASPDVDVEGMAAAKLGLDRLGVQLDRLDRKKVTVDINVDRGGGLRRLLPGGAGAAGAGGGSLGASLAGFAPGLSPLLTNPAAVTGIVVAALATIPFAATAAAGGIVAALGGGFTALGVMAAAKTKQVRKPFQDLFHQITVDMRSISTPFRDVLKDIANEAQAALPTIMIALGDAFKAIAGPLRTFGKTLIDTLASPAVTTAITSLGKAFGAILKALAPSLPSIVNQIADGINGIATAIADHPRIFADLINFLGHLVGWSLQAIGALTRVANWIVEFTRDVGHWLRVAWNAFTGFFTGVYQGAINFWHSLRALWNTIIDFIKKIPGRILGALASFGTLLVNRGKQLISGLWQGIQAIWRNVASWFAGMPRRVQGWFNGATGWLLQAGKNIIHGLLTGIRSFMAGIGSWVKGNIVDPIINAVKHFFGIHSPSTVMQGIGSNLVGGLLKGIVSANPVPLVMKVFGSMPKALGHIVGKGLISVAGLPGKALKALGGLAGKAWDFLGGLFKGPVGSGVEQWRGLVVKVLGMLGQSASWANTVLRRMNQESGGNPNAINNWDSNAQAGDPSRGLMQTIGSTFAAYAGPFRGRGIYDPLANIYAGLNYALHTYGSLSALNRPGGYALGGLITEPIVGMGASGRAYTFGERGEETVIPGRFSNRGVEARLEALTAVAADIPAMVGAAVADALDGVSRRGAYRGAYSAR